MPAREYPPCLARKIPRKPYNKSFPDQACSVKMAGYWPRSFLARLWTSTPSRSITWPISSHLDRTSLVSNPYLSTDATIKCFHMTSRQPYCIWCPKTIKRRNLVPREVPSLPPSMRLVTCLRIPTKAAQRVGPQLKFCRYCLGRGMLRCLF